VFDRHEASVSDLATAVQAALQGDGPIPRGRVVDWCRAAEDVEELALLYRLTGEAYYRIQPELGQSETCSLIQRYYLSCLRVDPSDDRGLSRYEAAWALVIWFQHLSRAAVDTSTVLREAASAVMQLYLEGDPELQTAIETGFLEHVLEDEEFRPLFSGWADDDRLRSAWESALAWGEAHPGFTRSLARRPTESS
jgi:hypothetical protein